MLGPKVWMFAWDTKNMDLFNKVHMSEPRKTHTYEPFISLISFMLNYG